MNWSGNFREGLARENKTLAKITAYTSKRTHLATSLLAKEQGEILVKWSDKQTYGHGWCWTLVVHNTMCVDYDRHQPGIYICICHTKEDTNVLIEHTGHTDFELLTTKLPFQRKWKSCAGRHRQTGSPLSGTLRPAPVVQGTADRSAADGQLAWPPRLRPSWRRVRSPARTAGTHLRCNPCRMQNERKLFGMICN